MDGRLEAYKQVADSFRQLAEMRFKLLALVPAVSGTAITLISKDIEAFKRDPIPRGLVALMAFIVTLGIVFYDVRNSQIYNSLIRRAKELESGMQLHGPFSARPPRSLRFLGLVSIWHDRGLALIYGSVLGAWMFPIVCGALWVLPAGSRPRNVVDLALVVAAVFSLVCIAELHRLDRRAGTADDRVSSQPRDGGEAGAPVPMKVQHR